MRGGPNRGQGRKKAPANTKKVPMQFRLAPDIAYAIRAQIGPQSAIIEQAIRAWLNLPEPSAHRGSIADDTKPSND